MSLAGRTIIFQTQEMRNRKKQKDREPVYGIIQDKVTVAAYQDVEGVAGVGVTQYVVTVKETDEVVMIEPGDIQMIEPVK